MESTSGKNPKPILKKKPPPKHVSFDGSESKKIAADASNKTYTRRNKPTKFGKGKANPVRDLLILIGILAMLMFMTRNFEAGLTKEEELTDPEEEKEDVVADTINSWADSVAEVFRKQTGRSQERTGECSMYLAKGSIPGTGYALFAGKQFDAGDVVVEKATSVFSIGKTSVPSHALLVKHHPMLANVQGDLIAEGSYGDLKSFQLRATRQIEIGEELFVDIASHPISSLSEKYQSLFDDVPTREEYAIADEIIDDAIITARNMAYVHRKKSFKVNKNFLFSIVRKSVARVNPRIGALVPGTTLTAKDREGISCSLTRMKNKTLQNHQFFSFCLDDLTVEVTDEDGRMVTSTQQFKSGETVTAVPVYVLPMDSKEGCGNDEECPAPSSPYLPYCLTYDSFRFCPLTNAIFLAQDDTRDANVELRWDDEDTLRERNASELQESPVGTVAWNLVALRDIKVGEELRMKPDLPLTKP